MKALAQFIMRGPVQAAGVAAAASALPLLFWIGAATVALVMLRVGIGAGLNVALWAALPAMAWLWAGQDPTALCVLLEVAVMALALRQTQHWEKALLFGAAAALVIGLSVPVLLPALFDELVQFGGQFLQDLNPQGPSQANEAAARSIMLASLAVSQFAMAIGSLMLGRSWQAKLFNPGGFRDEFHAFRLSLPMALGFAAAMVLLPQLGVDALLAVAVLGTPLVLAGIALVHGAVRKRGLGAGWLVGFYLMVLVLGPSLMLLLVLIAIIDSWVDFRSRIRPGNH